MSVTDDWRARVWAGLRLTPLLALWLCLAPMTFTVLYSVIELQAEARSAVGANGRLATFKTVLLADRLGLREGHQKALERQQDALNEALKKPLAERSRAEGGLAIARTRLTASLSPPTAAPNASSQPGVGAAPARDLEADVRNALRNLTAEARRGDRESGVERAELAARYQDYQDAQTQLIVADQDVSLLLNSIGKINADLDRVRNPKDSPADVDLLPVANSYLTLTRRPVGPIVEDFFTLPASALVALFTAFMGAVGAAVGSLAVEAGLTKSSARLTPYRAYLVRPLLGGMAGFTVFFVVSAGTTFLIRPGGEEAAGEAANLLSPAALASLGVFAGLASEAAIEWLRAKASAFFRTDDEDGRDADGRAAAPAEA